MAEKKTFEEQLKELEEVVKALQSPELTLDESMKLYKKGMSLTTSCTKELEKAEGELKKLTENLTEEDFSIEN
ncbi:MAG: exodeoxyribonuclease VII small subunit [Abditibacteriota bacterium]|nr:exodeoxyribonuclease VII small subunit [Abditibacteriota bacterium]